MSRVLNEMTAQISSRTTLVILGSRVEDLWLQKGKLRTWVVLIRNQSSLRSGKVLLSVLWLYEEQNSVRMQKGFLVELLESGDLYDFPLPFHRFWICVQVFVSIHWKLEGNSALFCFVGIVMLAFLWLLSTCQIWKLYQHLHFLL